MLENEGAKKRMSEQLIIHSAIKRIPEIRRDLQIIPVSDNGRTLLYFHDSMGYMPPHFALDISVEPLLNMFTGTYSVEQMADLTGHQLSTEMLLEFVQLLDKNLVLNSGYFRHQTEKINNIFEKGHERKPLLAGHIYPDEPKELTLFLQEIFRDISVNEKWNKQPRALYAPHIDLSVGIRQYAEAFIHLNEIRPTRVIVLGTAHYTGYYGRFYDNFPFIGSDKVFELPGCKIQPDREVLHHLNHGKNLNGFTLNDRAHRMEHSIEIHLLFARHFWQHNFSIVPILVGSFDELFYMSGGDLDSKIKRFSEDLNHWIDDDTFILVSGDLSHVGRKFGDDDSAGNMKNWVSELDRKFLKYASKGISTSMLTLLSEKYDQTRICGFPPLYLLLNLLRQHEGRIINYHWWDETETESAVSFGSILY
jgi:MEMO1 family protein